MIGLTFKYMKRRIKSIILTIITGSVALSMMMLAMYIYYNSGYCKDTIEEVLAYDISNIGMLYTEDYGNASSEEVELIFEELLKDGDIISIGEYENQCAGFANCELLDVYNEITGGNSEDLKTIHLSPGISDLFDIKLSEGEIDKQARTENYEELVYLGSAYKDYYSVGDVVKYDLGYDLCVTLTIKGFLEDGNRIIDAATMSYPTSFVASEICSYTLKDTDIIMMNTQIGRGTEFCVWDKSCTYKEICEKIRDIAIKKNIRMDVVSLSAIIDEKDRTGRQINEYILDVLWIVIFVTVIMLSSIQITTILNSRSEFGIMYSTGFSTGDIIGMTVAENVIKMIVMYFTSLYLVKFLIKKIFIGIEGQAAIINEIFEKYIYSYSAVVIVIIMIIATIVPIWIIYRMKPVELIGGNDT